MNETKLAVIDGQTLMDTMRFEKRRCQRRKPLNTGLPPKPSASGFGGKRTSDRESELRRWRQSEGFVVRLDDGKQSACPTLSVGAFQWAKPKPLFLRTGGI